MVANLVIFYKMTMILVYHSSIYPVCCLIVNFMKFSDFDDDNMNSGDDCNKNCQIEQGFNGESIKVKTIPGTLQLECNGSFTVYYVLINSS